MFWGRTRLIYSTGRDQQPLAFDMVASRAAKLIRTEDLLDHITFNCVLCTIRMTSSQVYNTPWYSIIRLVIFISSLQYHVALAVNFTFHKKVWGALNSSSERKRNGLYRV